FLPPRWRDAVRAPWPTARRAGFHPMSFPVFLLSWLIFLAAVLVLFSVFLARRVERALPPRGSWLEVDGQRVHYRVLGEGPPIVLVHGLGGQMRNFDYLPLQELAGKF